MHSSWKTMWKPISLFSVITLTACSHAPTSSVEPQPIQNAVLSNESAVTPQSFILRGDVTVGHETQTITPCGSKQQYWLHLTPKQQKTFNDLARKPYQPMYGELIGYFKAPPRAGLSSDFPAQFIVTQVNLLSAEMSTGCQRAPQPTKAFGTEPFWNITTQKGQLSFTKMGEDSQQQTITQQDIKLKQRQYSAHDAEITIKQAQCSDGMSDSLYGWQSTVQWQQDHYQGCATLANTDITQNWVGQYQGHSPSASSSGLTISVTLNADHTATTRYDYQTNEPSLIESGVWQQINANQVHVLMSRHQRQYLIAERIFTREGNKLVARQEKVNGKVYGLGTEGVTLFLDQNNGSIQ